MADVWFKMGYGIALDVMLPSNTGSATLPNGIKSNNSGGIYLILNGGQRNRYMGITKDVEKRFAGRQGACFELGFPQSVLTNVYALIGKVKYRDNGSNTWTTVTDYSATTIYLDNQSYDFEHLYIKSVQNMFPHDTITNTKKVSQLWNTHNSHSINVQLTWSGGTWNNSISNSTGESISLAAGKSWKK